MGSGVVRAGEPRVRSSALAVLSCQSAVSSFSLLRRTYHAGAMRMENLEKISRKDLKAKTKAAKEAEKNGESGKSSETQDGTVNNGDTASVGGDAATSSSAGSSSDGDGSETATRIYATPEITADAKRHKEGLKDPDLPVWQNPLHHNNPDYNKIFREEFDSEEEFQSKVCKLPPVERPDGSIPVPKHIEELCDDLLQLNMLEMNELVSRMEEHFGFDESRLEPAGDDADGGSGGDDDEDGGKEKEEKTAFDIKLTAFDAKSKIKIIKEVRALADLGLKEAKELVEGTPTIIRKDVSKETADEVKAKLEELGAQVEIV